MKFLKKLKREWKNILFNLLIMISSLLVVIFSNEKEILATTILLAIGIGGLIKWRSKITIAVFGLVGILFGLGEIIVCYNQIWVYQTNFFKVPIWLFVLWANTGAFIYQTSLEIKKLGIKEK